MSAESSEPIEQAEPTSRLKPLRIWPPILLLIGMAVLRYLPLMLEDGPPMLWMSAAFGPALCSIAILLWWLIASRAAWYERLTGFVVLIAALVITVATVDKSMIGPGTLTVTLPMGFAGFALATIVCAQLLSFRRTVIALLVAIAGFGYSTLLRSAGMWGDFGMTLSWRWTPTNEEKLLAQPGAAAPAQNVVAELQAALANPTWPGFRGPNRDARQHGPKIDSDWSANPPELLWKSFVGPGWSSFVIAGDYLFTQEQRGPNEAIVCYAADTGKEIWKQEIESRIEDPLGGPGPRATPTLADGGLYAMGSTGYLMRLDAATGEVVWKQDLRELAECETPMWGFSASPLVVDSLVICYSGAPGDKGLLALDAATGEIRWSAPSGTKSYSSPQFATVAGEPLILMLTDLGLDLIDPATGKVRLNFEWVYEGYRAVQPEVIDDDTILIPTGLGQGTHAIRINKSGDELTAEELWTSRNMKPDFNDMVVHKGHAYGFDVAIFSSIDLATGDRNWKGGRYGKGQVLLLADSDLLLVISEEGEAILLKADPEELVELAKLPALEGKTWNHPVVVSDRLYVRNSQEAACYRLPLVQEVAAQAAP
ncbi:PQQ-like beta-propeller repeat protein [Blastopirellula sp. JC732]|uniref:PQQ-like beta-propeller repeat protein n=1 Tax=Blastopirellula sediminis TaxID=2894196 RepID=A0A9X1MI05_9BACT|nr:PQQ-binding-like beta-propeller repeat protein [Blastopirellula sediminis]MCC9604406.1 PQQ-like beta-propeller repeat protein [Blastopirellula sediminis]MCC9626926.1 PQQ-like beta-propeller repeat protein [Blastopirellula sediminis]